MCCTNFLPQQMPSWRLQNSQVPKIFGLNWSTLATNRPKNSGNTPNKKNVLGKSPKNLGKKLEHGSRNLDPRTLAEKNHLQTARSPKELSHFDETWGINHSLAWTRGGGGLNAGMPTGAQDMCDWCKHAHHGTMHHLTFPCTKPFLF